MNNLLVDNELVGLCVQILGENKASNGWDLIESEDYFQTAHYIGGWDATEQAFCFSYYDEQKKNIGFRCH